MDAGEVQAGLGGRACHPVTFTQTPASIRRVAPELGEHTQEILKERLGYNDEQIAELVIEGVITS